MLVPRYLSSRPALDLDPETVSAFERLFAESVAPGAGTVIDYTLAAPKWQFLC